MTAPWRSTILTVLLALATLAGCAHRDIGVDGKTLYPPVPTSIEGMPIEGIYAPNSDGEERLLAGITRSTSGNSRTQVLKSIRDGAAEMSVEALGDQLCTGHGPAVQEPRRIGPHRWKVECSFDGRAPRECFDGSHRIKCHPLPGSPKVAGWYVTVYDNWPLINPNDWCPHKLAVSQMVGYFNHNPALDPIILEQKRLAQDEERRMLDVCQAYTSIPDAPHGAPDNNVIY